MKKNHFFVLGIALTLTHSAWAEDSRPQVVQNFSHVSLEKWQKSDSQEKAQYHGLAILRMAETAREAKAFDQFYLTEKDVEALKLGSDHLVGDEDLIEVSRYPSMALSLILTKGITSSEEAVKLASIQALGNLCNLDKAPTTQLTCIKTLQDIQNAEGSDELKATAKVALDRLDVCHYPVLQNSEIGRNALKAVTQLQNSATELMSEAITCKTPEELYTFMNTPGVYEHHGVQGKMLPGQHFFMSIQDGFNGVYASKGNWDPSYKPAEVKSAK